MVNVGLASWKGRFLTRGDFWLAECVASENCCFYGVEKFLQAISVSARSKSDEFDNFPQEGPPKRLIAHAHNPLPFCF